MRDFLDAILAGIGSTSLTDEEWAFSELQALTTPGYGLDNYAALLLVLDTRETVSATRDRLRYGFLAHGTQIGESPVAKSEIFLGAGLCK